MHASRLFFCVAALVAIIGFSQPVYAQLLPSAGTEKTAAEQPKPAYAPDALNRRHPRGAVLGYIKAMADEDYKKATLYLDVEHLSKAKIKNKDMLALNLQTLLDKSGTLEAVNMLNDTPDGQQNDGLKPDLDRVGSFKSGGETIPVLLVRTQGENGGPIWLFSSQTLEQVPDKPPEIEALSINRFLPASMIENKWAGVPAGHWLAMLALVMLSYLAAWLVTKVFALFASKVSARVKYIRPDGFIAAFSLPARLYLGVWIFVAVAEQIGISIIVRQYFSKATVVVAWVAVLLLFWRMIDVAATYGEKHVTRHGNYGALSAILFFRRSVKFILMAIGGITILDTFGLDITTSLAAFGIGGIALALGAQKTVENLVGSLTVIFDQPVRVGDFCQVGAILGTVEQIGMRSTRLRTNSRTLVTIPNDRFASETIENFTHRDRFWFHPIIGLRYETTPLQIKFVLEEFRSMLKADEKINSDTARVRFIELDADSLNIEIFAYAMVPDFASFLEVKERLLIRIMEIIKESGTDFAFPLQMLYLARDAGLSKEKTASAEAKVRERENQGEVPAASGTGSR